MKVFCIAAVLAALAMPQLAAGQAIDTNRPGFSFSPNVVGLGQWQLETGFSYNRSDSDSYTSTLPGVEIRYGVVDQLEIFLSSVTWVKTKSNSNESNGLADMVFGTKIKLSDADASTQTAVLFQFSVPVGDSDFSSDRWDPGLAFVWAHSGSFPIAGTVKISKFRNGFQLDNGLKMPFSWGDAHSGFVEWEANLPEGGGSAHWLNGGYQWLMNERVQLDFNAGVGLNNRADDFRLGVGFSMRL